MLPSGSLRLNLRVTTLAWVRRFRERQGASRRFFRGNVYSTGPVASAFPLAFPGLNL